MRKQRLPRPFLVASNDPNPSDSSEFTDDDLRNAFEQIPFDLDSLTDEDSEDA